MTAPTPETVREIAGRLYRGEPCTREDAEMLLWCATQWQRVNKALDEIANSALQEARDAEAEAHARREAMRSPVVVQFRNPASGRMRVSGGMS